MSQAQIKKIDKTLLDAHGVFEEEYWPESDIDTTTLRHHLEMFFERHPDESIIAYETMGQLDDLSEESNQIDTIWTTNWVLVRISSIGSSFLLDIKRNPRRDDLAFNKMYFVGDN